MSGGEEAGRGRRGLALALVPLVSLVPERLMRSFGGTRNGYSLIPPAHEGWRKHVTWSTTLLEL